MIKVTKKKHIYIEDDEILYIMTSLPPGKLLIVTKVDEIIEMWGNVRNMQDQLPHFLRPMASTLINPEIIEFIDYKRQVVKTTKGDFKIGRTRIAQLKEQVHDSNHEIPTSDDRRKDTDKRQQDDSSAVRGDSEVS